MNPILKLGPYDSPSIEFYRSEIDPIVFLMVEVNRPLSPLDLDHVLSFVELDSLYLDDASLGFFLMLESVSKKIVGGELTRFTINEDLPAAFKSHFDRYPSDGLITQESKLAAQRFLDFLGRHSNHWPRQ